MCSAATLVTLYSGKIKSSSLLNLRQDTDQVFMKILANEKPQKSRVTAFFDDKKQPLPNPIINLLENVNLLHLMVLKINY